MEMCREYALQANGWTFDLYQNSNVNTGEVLLPGVEFVTNFPLLSSTRVGKIIEIYSLYYPISTAVRIAVNKFRNSPSGCRECCAGIMAGNGNCQGIDVEQCVLANRIRHVNGAGEIVDVIYRCQGSRKIQNGGIYPYQPNCLALPKRIVDPLTSGEG